MDETYVKVSGRWTYLYRAIDQHGQVVDVLLSAHRDLAAARTFSHDAHQPGSRIFGRERAPYGQSPDQHPMMSVARV